MPNLKPHPLKPLHDLGDRFAITLLRRLRSKVQGPQDPASEGADLLADAALYLQDRARYFRSITGQPYIGQASGSFDVQGQS